MESGAKKGKKEEIRERERGNKLESKGEAIVKWGLWSRGEDNWEKNKRGKRNWSEWEIRGGWKVGEKREKEQDIKRGQ